MVPKDWDGESYTMYFLCVPDSLSWRSVINGAISQVVWHYNYDAESGDTQEAAQVGAEIWSTTMSCSLDDLVNGLESIAEAIQSNSTSGCGCPDGSEAPKDPSTSPALPIGPGQEFPDLPTYLGYKCGVATAIQDDFQDTIDQLSRHDVDTLFGGGIALAFGIVAGLLSTGPVGWGVGLVIGVVSAVVVLLSKQLVLDFGDLAAALVSERDDLICAMYLSSSPEDAKQSYLGVLTGLGTLTVVELEIIDLIFTGNLADTLFEPIAQSSQVAGTVQSDCSGCGNICDPPSLPYPMCLRTVCTTCRSAQGK